MSRGTAQVRGIKQGSGNSDSKPATIRATKSLEIYPLNCYACCIVPGITKQANCLKSLSFTLGGWLYRESYTTQCLSDSLCCWLCPNDFPEMLSICMKHPSGVPTCWHPSGWTTQVSGNHQSGKIGGPEVPVHGQCVPSLSQLAFWSMEHFNRVNFRLRMAHLVMGISSFSWFRWHLWH